MKPLPFFAALLLLVPLFAGCYGGTSASSSTEATTGESSPPAAVSQAGEPAAAAAGDLRQIQVPGGSFQLPADWVREQPAMSMRLAQAQIPGSGGPGQLTMFHFGAGGGGGTDANLQRWVGQMEADSEPSRDSFTLGTWKVTWVEVTGTLKPSSMGTGPSDPQPGSRLFGAVVEGEGGPWFFKATGPAATLDEQRDAFLELLKSGRPNA